MDCFALLRVTTRGYHSTLDELLEVFSDHIIYGLDDNEDICVLNPDGTIYATFERVEGETDLYCLYRMDYDNLYFSEVARLWANKIVKLSKEVN